MLKLHFTKKEEIQKVSTQFALECIPGIPVFFYGENSEAKWTFLEAVFSKLTEEVIILPKTSPQFVTRLASKQAEVHFYDFTKKERTQVFEKLGDDIMFHEKNYFFAVGGLELTIRGLMPAVRAEIHMTILHDGSGDFEFQFFHTALPEEEILLLEEKYPLPSILEKEKQEVEFTGKKLIKTILEYGEILDIELIESLLRLSKTFAVLDLSEEEFQNVFANESVDLSSFWRTQRIKFKGKNSIDALYEYFREKEIGHIARAFLSQNLVLFNTSRKSWYEKIVFYVNKRVLNGKKVPLQTFLAYYYQKYPSVNKKLMESYLADIENCLIGKVGKEEFDVKIEEDTKRETLLIEREKDDTILYVIIVLLILTCVLMYIWKDF